MWLILILPFLLLADSEYSSENIILSTAPEELLAATKVISVKNYPPDLQATYEVFQAKCTTCHGAEDSLGAKEVLPSYWETTIHRMQAMQDSNLSSGDAEQITQFFIYDSAKRRRSLLESQLKKLSPEEKASEQSKIDAVLKRYAS